MFFGILFSANIFADSTRSGYYDAKAEGIFVALNNCSYTVDFKFYGHKQPAYGNVRREIQSYMKKVIVPRFRYNERDYYNRYHEEENYMYFLQQVPPKGIMVLKYIFTDRMGNIYQRSEKIYKPRYHKKFPSWSAIPRECNRDYRGKVIDSIRGRYRSFRDAESRDFIEKSKNYIKNKLREHRRREGLQ